MKIVQALEDFNTLLKGVTKTGNNLPKNTRDGTYVINLDEYADVGTHWITFLCSRSGMVYFDSFGVEHVPEEIKYFIGNKNIIVNIF